MSKPLQLSLAGCFFALALNAQTAPSPWKFSRKDSLFGGVRPERSAFDWQTSILVLRPDFKTKTLAGTADHVFTVRKPFPLRIQVDADSTLKLDSVFINNAKATGKNSWTSQDVFRSARFERVSNRSGFVHLDEVARKRIEANESDQLFLGIKYSGKPRMAAKPPWDGGLIWRKDSLGRDWLTVACQGDGASLWWPCKDDVSDEPDNGVTVHLEVPSKMTAVSNGKLVKTEPGGETTTFSYMVSHPINSYNVTMNVGHYTNREHTIKLESGKEIPFTVSALDYHIDSYDKYLAFEGDRAVRVFSKLFGDYPWASDGYRLVEVPYWGMEHQSCVAYGNKLKRNAFGFDFIVVHETGHEWWGNALSAADNADFWLHEGFCTYSEVLFLEEVKDKGTADRYFKDYILHNMKGTGVMRGPEGVAFNGYETEPYYRGAAIIHLFRYVLNDDTLFRKTLKDILAAHRDTPATTSSVLAAIRQSTGRDFSPLFWQYLGTKGYPVLAYTVQNGKLRYKLSNAEKGLTLPVTVKLGEETLALNAKTTWQAVDLRRSVKTRSVPTIELVQPFYLLRTEALTVQK